MAIKFHRILGQLDKLQVSMPFGLIDFQRIQRQLNRVCYYHNLLTYRKYSLDRTVETEKKKKLLSVEEEPKYIEKIQMDQIKSSDFYDFHAKSKRYFYHIDLQGRLFIENVLPKNVATCLKSEKFLNFFFHRLQKNNLKLLEEDYPFISPCGKEMNFIRAADTPIVFSHFEEINEKTLLVYGGSLSELFDPKLLTWDSKTGRIYHPVRTHKRLAGTVGLIRSACSLSLSNSFIMENNETISFYWKGCLYPIEMI